MQGQIANELGGVDSDGVYLMLCIPGEVVLVASFHCMWEVALIVTIPVVSTVIPASHTTP